MNIEFKLTDEQNIAIDKKDCFVVSSCPGSGKTLSVAARIANLKNTWLYQNRGIAALSFTNVAWEEIETYLKESFKIQTPLAYPHFLGTIDSFINKYIFLPFGHIVMKCNKRPVMVGQPYNDWEPIGEGWYWANGECNRNRCKLNDFSYDVNDNLQNFDPKSHFNNCQINHNVCSRRKELFNRQGYATQLDANYFAYKILQQNPQIAKALAYRFPFLIIDEAQDSSEIQFKIIDLLIDNGLSEVMLIGDPDQAIFEWRTATPNLFKQKYEEWEANSCRLNENWRSSQKICNFFSKISSSDVIPLGKNPDYKDFDFDPEIWTYDSDNRYVDLVNAYIELCRAKGIELIPSKIAILSRSKELLEKIQVVNPIKYPWNDVNTKYLVLSKLLYNQRNYKDSFTLIEKVIYNILNEGNNDFTCSNINEFRKFYGLVKWRKDIFQLLVALPNTKSTLGQWIAETQNILNSNNLKYQLKIKRDNINDKYSEILLPNLFSPVISQNQLINFYIGTVHSVKGKSYDAVLLFVKSKGGNNQAYKNILNSNSLNNEELRIVYVAITRPRKVLIIAVPNTDSEVWENKFLENNAVLY